MKSFPFLYLLFFFFLFFRTHLLPFLLPKLRFCSKLVALPQWPPKQRPLLLLKLKNKLPLDTYLLHRTTLIKSRCWPNNTPPFSTTKPLHHIQIPMVLRHPPILDRHSLRLFWQNCYLYFLLSLKTISSTDLKTGPGPGLLHIPSVGSHYCRQTSLRGWIESSPSKGIHGDNLAFMTP